MATISPAQTRGTMDTLTLSLTEAIQLAVKQNPQLQSVQMDEEINKLRKLSKESIASGRSAMSKVRDKNLLCGRY